MKRKHNSPTDERECILRHVVIRLAKSMKKLKCAKNHEIEMAAYAIKCELDDLVEWLQGRVARTAKRKGGIGRV
jgi:hypothetical protein